MSQPRNIYTHSIKYFLGPVRELGIYEIVVLNADEMRAIWC